MRTGCPRHPHHRSTVPSCVLAKLASAATSLGFDTFAAMPATDAPVCSCSSSLTVERTRSSERDDTMTLSPVLRNSFAKARPMPTAIHDDLDDY